MINMKNRNETKDIYMLLEPNYLTPVWYEQTIIGLKNIAAKHKFNVNQIIDINEIPKEVNVIVVIGTTKDWLSEAIDNCRKNELKVILTGAVPSKYGDDVSGTLYDAKSSIKELVQYFCAHGRQKLALIDINPNSSNDVAKYEAFINIANELNINVSTKDVYFRDSDSNNSTDLFLTRIDKYDGVLCGNDYSAAFLLSYAKKHGVKVPDDLFVAGLGDIVLCNYTEPTLTSANRSYYEAGEQVFDIWKQLNQNPNIVSIITTMKSTIIPRGSTANLEVLESNGAPIKPKKNTVPRYSMEGTAELKAIEDCIARCDDLDMKIIAELLLDKSNEAIASDLFIAPGTINYRLKKLYNSANVNNKSELLSLIKRHLSVDALTDYVQSNL